MSSFAREHEIDCPDNRGMRKFLWHGYFHDSRILSVDFSRSRSDEVVARIYCARDEYEEYRRLDGTREERLRLIEAHPERHTYLLRFEQVKCFRRRAETSADCDEYLYGTFLDSAALRRLQKDEKRKLYHLRIETVQGRIDLIFERFSVRKEAGRVNYSLAAYDHWGYGKGVDDWPVHPVWQIPAEQADENEYDRDLRTFKTLKYMEQNGETELLPAVRSCLQSNLPFEDAKPYAIVLLGRRGDASDIPLLQKIYREIPGKLQKEGCSWGTVEDVREEILEAIDLICLRTAEEED